MIGFLRWLFGSDRKEKIPVYEKKKPKRGKWVNSPEGGWMWIRDPRDLAEPRNLDK